MKSDRLSRFLQSVYDTCEIFTQLFSCQQISPRKILFILNLSVLLFSL